MKIKYRKNDSWSIERIEIASSINIKKDIQCFLENKYPMYKQGHDIDIVDIQLIYEDSDLIAYVSFAVLDTKS